MNSQVELAYGALSIVEILEKRGYELYRSDALAIMKTFAKFKLFEKSEELECWYDGGDDEEFASKAKDIMIIPNLSFNDLIQLRPEKAAKLLTPTDYYKFLITKWIWPWPGVIQKINGFLNRFNLPLVEKMSRGFFRSWALEPFLGLTRNRLTDCCCELVIQNLNNQDLYNICLAAEIAAKEENRDT
uniref:Uncharacterized protein n=1 Tax=Trichogramma kaykai TaxID=54128 RepID=A0ABD2XPU9_9HYME